MYFYEDLYFIPTYLFIFEMTKNNFYTQEKRTPHITVNYCTFYINNKQR